MIVAFIADVPERERLGEGLLELGVSSSPWSGSELPALAEEQFGILLSNSPVTADANRWLVATVGKAPESLVYLDGPAVQHQLRLLVNLAQEKAANARQALGRLAHDVNNALAPITFCAALLKGVPMEEEDLELVTSIEDGARKAADTMAQMQIIIRGKKG